MHLPRVNSYRRSKTFIHWVMEEPSSPYRKWYHLAMMVLVLISLGVMVRENTQGLSSEELWYLSNLSDNITVIFLFEYVLRWWTCSDLVVDFQHGVRRLSRRTFRPNPVFLVANGLALAISNKLRWMVRPMAVIDLLSVLPMFRIFRLLRVFTLLKFFRYSRRLAFFGDIMEERRYEMISLLFAGFVIWGTVAIAFYLAEHPFNEKVDSLWTSIYWAIITITTVGYGDIAPATGLGRGIAAVGVLVGMSVTVLMTSLMVSVFTERIFSLKEYHMERQIERLRNHFIVCGLDALGQVACESLLAEDKDFVAIDLDPARVDRAIKSGWLAIRGDLNDPDTWHRAGLTRASCVISAILNEATNVYIILNVRELQPKCFIVACGSSKSSENRLLRVGADRVVAPFQTAGQQMAQTALRPSALQLFRLALDQQHAALEMEEIRIAPGSPFDGVSLQKSDIRNGYDTIVVGVLSGGKTMHFNPRAGQILNAGDVLICLGHKDDMERLKRASRQVSLDKTGTELVIAEIWIPPDSLLDGVAIQNAGLRENYDAIVVGVINDGKNVQFNPPPDVPLTAGDVIICLGHKANLDALRRVVGEEAQVVLQQSPIHVEMEQIQVPTGSPFHGITLLKSTIRQTFACNVVGIIGKDGETQFNPKADYRIVAGDILICLGERKHLEKLRHSIES